MKPAMAILAPFTTEFLWAYKDIRTTPTTPAPTTPAREACGYYLPVTWLKIPRAAAFLHDLCQGRHEHLPKVLASGRLDQFNNHLLEPSTVRAR